MNKTILFTTASALLLSVGCAEKKEAAAETPKADAPAEAAPVKAEAPAEAKAETKVAEVSVDDVDKWLQGKAKVAVYDANGKSTRESQGVIPGATLLESSSQYNAVSVLPSEKDTKLVFYCGSTSCTASDGAAAKAVEAGYSDVCVLRAGIKGWNEAGKKTMTLAEAEAAQPKAAAPAEEKKEG